MRSGLRDLAAQFRGALGDFQRVWDALDDFDAHTWVLEPERPTRDAVIHPPRCDVEESRNHTCAFWRAKRNGGC